MLLEQETGRSGPHGWQEPPGSTAARYAEVRGLTERLCSPLAIEDYGVQSMPDASPAKWHLAHTTWFFESFLLAPFQSDYRPFDPRFAHLFNSYYNAAGQPWPRAHRGLLSRPTVEEVYRYRSHVDDHVRGLLQGQGRSAGNSPAVLAILALGLNHEQQHQELLLTDVKHAFGSNPLRPAYRTTSSHASVSHDPSPLHWIDYPGGLRWLGHEGEDFAYDNETPRHKQYVAPFRLASRLVTNGEYRAFMEDGGYRRPELWLSDGWATCRTEGWEAPLYWEKQGNNWTSLTLDGPRPISDAEPVCHVSHYEADAYARWAGARLPTEAEWEVAAIDCPLTGGFLDGDRLHPAPSLRARAAQDDSDLPAQMFGELWQWTSSPYIAYPGYRPPSAAHDSAGTFWGLSEYNAKFFGAGQYVLRGGSCVTPRSHFRRTYRNFFPPQARWQFTGIRLARDLPHDT
jgi:ergothioneine biosynthesis protein EgtB